MVLNDTFKNISVISWRSVLLVEETGIPGENTDSDYPFGSSNSSYGPIYPIPAG